MISYRQADIIDRIQSQNAPLGVVRVVNQYFGPKRAVTAYLLELYRGNGDSSKMDAVVKFADDVWSSLPAVATNAYILNPQGFISPYPPGLTLTMESHDYDGGGIKPSPLFIDTAIQMAFKNRGIKNTHPDEEILREESNEKYVALCGEYFIKWSDIPDSFKVVKADLIDNINRKREREWKQHRIERMVGYLFGFWRRYWGEESEFHNPRELLDLLTNRRDPGFIRAIEEEYPLTTSEFKEFMDDPQTKAMFLEKFEKFARDLGWSGPLGIRSADLMETFKQSVPTKFNVKFHINESNHQLRFIGVIHDNSQSFTSQMQDRRNYVEKLLQIFFRSYGFYEQDNNWILDLKTPLPFRESMDFILKIRAELLNYDHDHRITDDKSEIKDLGNERWSFEVAVK